MRILIKIVRLILVPLVGGLAGCSGLVRYTSAGKSVELDFNQPAAPTDSTVTASVGH